MKGGKLTRVVELDGWNRSRAMFQRNDICRGTTLTVEASQEAAVIVITRLGNVKAMVQ